MTPLLHSICRKLHRDGALVDILADCHTHIRRFADLAVAVGERTDIGGAVVANAAGRVERYFAKAFPLHVEDEEASILPRLRGRSSRIDAALARMREQHDAYDVLLDQVCAYAFALRSTPDDRTERDALASVARPLRAFLNEHLAAEEKVLFPEIREQLSRAEERLVRREMEDRRRIG